MCYSVEVQQTLTFVGLGESSQVAFERAKILLAFVSEIQMDILEDVSSGCWRLISCSAARATPTISSREPRQYDGLQPRS